ncbi:MAG: 7-cyano-7-deazaguanine synthase QueC [Rhodospirillaceae bacterium]|nr:7-cyano-7-deazaguanine synthase QueC [Rhodospirillaceae bacterium]
MSEDGALVLLSGGQDSATCLAWALTHFTHVETVGFDYHQRHRVELDVRLEFLSLLCAVFPDWASRLGDDRILDASALTAIGQTAMTQDMAIEIGENGLPNTFVPGRNILFLTLAAALAYRRGLRHIITGVCETDYSGYPDCRDDTIKALQVALNLGMESRFVLHTPLMRIDKAATWQLAQDLGGQDLVDMIRDHTHSCYIGDHVTHHDWGFGCGQCPACHLRADGWRRWTKA